METKYEISSEDKSITENFDIDNEIAQEILNVIQCHFHGMKACDAANRILSIFIRVLSYIFIEVLAKHNVESQQILAAFFYDRLKNIIDIKHKNDMERAN
jgi:hypothetical protein